MHELFGYDDAILERFPTVRAGLVHVVGVDNSASPPGLVDEFRAEQQRVSQGLRSTSVAEIASVSAWRRTFAGFGVKPTQYRSAIESLLRRLDKQGDIPVINMLVDIGNLVSIRHAMPVAVFDRGGVDGSLTVRFARGDEPFADLGSSESVHPEPGEVVFVDESATVAARRWCWRQSAASATNRATTEALFVVEGHHDGADADTAKASADIEALLGVYQGRSPLLAYHLSPAEPRV